MAQTFFRAARFDRAADLLFGLSPRSVRGIALLSLTSIFGIFGLILDASRLDVGAAARTATSNLAVAVSRQIDGEIEMLSLSLDDLVEGASNPATFALPTDLHRAILFDSSADAQGHGSLFLIDASGHLSEQAGAKAAPPIDFSRESIFRVHTGPEDVGLYVSGAFVSLVDGEPSLAMSRRVTRNGAFAGVGVATLRLSSVRGLFSALDLGQGGSASLIANDGSMLVRTPFVRNVASLQVVNPTARRQLGVGQPTQSEFVSGIDGIRRIVASAPVGHYPLTVFVGASTGEIYAAWWHRAELTALAMALLGNVILVLITALQVSLHRRELAETALAVLARTDKLSGLANRRCFDETLEREWARAARVRQPLALLLLDIDHFKAFNDLFGHPGGDAAIASIADCIARALRRPTDLAARYGGEEFAVLLPNTGADGALDIAASIRERRQPHPRSPSSILSASIGVAAVVPIDGQSATALVEMADISLYQAKRAGRDQIKLWRDPAAA